MKRHLIYALVLVAAVVAGAFGLLGRHFGDISRAVDTRLTEAGHNLQNEPIDAEWAVTQVAESAAPIALLVAGTLVVSLIGVVVHGLKKQAERLPGSRRRRRIKGAAHGGPEGAEG